MFFLLLWLFFLREFQPIASAPNDSSVIRPRNQLGFGENYLVFLEYHKCILSHLTWMVGPTMNLISWKHHSCERREYVFMVFREYTIISRFWCRWELNPRSCIQPSETLPVKLTKTHCFSYYNLAKLIIILISKHFQTLVPLMYFLIVNGHFRDKFYGSTEWLSPIA